MLTSPCCGEAGPTRPPFLAAVAVAIAAALATSLALSGCYALRFNDGGADVEFKGARQVDPAGVALPPGYRIELVAAGLDMPTGVTFDRDGQPCVVESGYSYGEVFATPRLLRLEPDGSRTTLAEGRNGPWTGVVADDGVFYIAEGGVLEGGRILRVDSEGAVTVLIDDLPSVGDHHTNGPALAPDGSLYFGIGSATNSGVVGDDNIAFGWVGRYPRFCDIPGETITLRGQNFESETRQGTGAYSPLGVSAFEGETIRGETLCTGSLLSIPATGGEPTLVAWGFRNPFGMAIAPDGALYVTDNGYDDRGSRPVWGSPDVLWRVESGAWYGWPDYVAGRPVTNEEFDVPGGPDPEPLLLVPPGVPPQPVVEFECHSSADGFDFSRSEEFGHVGQAFVALFGDQAPATNKLLGAVGFKVVRVDVQTGAMEEFAVNRGPENGPASKVGGGGLERPIAARFSPDGRELYVVDFGVLTQPAPDKAVPRRQTGVLWKIARDASTAPIASATTEAATTEAEAFAEGSP